MKKIKIIILFVFLTSFLNSQTIKNRGTLRLNYYSPKDYDAARQVWCGIQDKRGLLYFATADGTVLEFDGQNWKKIQVSTYSISALNVDKNNIIYVGGVNTIGYLKPSANGELKFHSLKHLLPPFYQKFDKIWDIIFPDDSTVVFQTFYELFIYRHNKIKVIDVDHYQEKGVFLFLFEPDSNNIIVYVKKKGLYRLEKDTLIFIPSSSIFEYPTENGQFHNAIVRAILPYKEKYVIITWYDGVFLMDKKFNITPIETPIDDIIHTKVYKATSYKNKYFIFQLHNTGILITDLNFNIIQFFKSPTAFNVFFDNQDNLWLSTSNGIYSVNLFSPFTYFKSKYGFSEISTCKDAIEYDNKLFVAASNGLYYRDWTTAGDQLNPEKFKKVFDPTGLLKNYKLDTLDNTLFGSSASGFFRLVRKNDKISVDYILENQGVRDFAFDKENKNVIVAVSKNILIFKKINGQWKHINSFPNFSAQHVVQDKEGLFWISNNQGNGLIRVKFSPDFDSIQTFFNYSVEDKTLNGLPSDRNINVYPVDDDIIFTTTEGLYRYNYSSNSFYPDTELNKIIGDGLITHLYQDLEKNIWIKKYYNKSWYLLKIERTKDSLRLIYKPFLQFKNRIYSFSQISPTEYVIGDIDGFVHYDTSIPFTSDKPFKAFIRSVKILPSDSIIFGGTFITQDSLIRTEQASNQIPVIDYKYNNLRFNFSGAFYEDPKGIKYKFFLDGNDQDWSDWTSENYKDYSNLNVGEYTFYVQAKNVYDEKSSIASFSFIIKPPWYKTTLAYIMYVLLAGGLVWLIVYLYTLRLRLQKEYLEEQVRLRTKKIEAQKGEIEAQRDQLAQKNIEIEKINKDLTDSIEYAKRIQTAILPLQKNIAKYLKDYFILFRPRDIVSGDFYWFTHKENKSFIAAVDCTGHGVPGAFMSMIGAEMLTTIVSNENIYDAAQILTKLNIYIRKALKQDATENQDGMDMALCVIDHNSNKLEFAGAKRPLFYIHDNEIFKLKGSRQSIGGFQFGEFTKEVVEYTSPTWFYIFSDGYADQFGGDSPDGAEKFMVKRFKNLLLEIHQKPMEEQKFILNKTIEDWMGDEKQTDDILVIGFKL